MPTDKRQRQKEGTRARREAAMAAARRQQRKRRLIISAVLGVIVLGLLLLVSIAGGDDSEDEQASGATSTSTTSKPPTTMPKPTIEVPSEPPPTELKTEDLEVGTGREVKLGDEIEVNYVGVRYADGEEFDSSWDSGRTATFQLVEGALIDGWVQGIPGMKVGGRRQLVIPSEMAYGDNPGAGRPAGALIFIVDLVAIK